MISFAPLFSELSVPHVWAARNEYTIVDASFGDGHLFLHLWDAWHRAPKRCSRLHVVGVVPRLVDSRTLRARLLQTCSPELGSYVDQLVDVWPLDLLGIHRFDFAGMQVTLTLAVGHEATMLGRLSVRADAVVLPPSLRTDPAAEVDAIFAIASKLLMPGGKLLMPWSSVGQAADILSDRDTTLWKQGALRDGIWSRVDPRTQSSLSFSCQSPRDAVVVGGGFAGAGVAFALALRGWTVRVLEGSSALQGPHKGHLAAALTPMLTRDDDIRARLSRAGTLRAHHRWGHLSTEVFEQCGALQLSRTSGRVVDLESVVSGLRLPSEWARFVDAKQASAIAGLTLNRGGIYFPMAVRVQPEAFIDRLLSRTEISRRVARVHRVNRRGAVWQVLDEVGQVLDEAPVVIVAAAGATQDILSSSGLLSDHARLRTMHQLGGEITYIPEGAISGGPHCIVSGDGYVLPAVGGQCVTGSSYLHGAERVCVTPSGARENLQRANGLLGTQLVDTDLDPMTTNGWAGWRAVLPGRLPAMGAVDEDRSLWALAGFASRGLTWSSLAGDLVAAALNSEPLPLETDIIDKISQI